MTDNNQALIELTKAQKLEESAFKNKDFHDGFQEGISTAITLIMGDAAIREDAGRKPHGSEAGMVGRELAESPKSTSTLNREALAIAYEAYTKAATYRPTSDEFLAAAIRAYLAAEHDPECGRQYGNLTYMCARCCAPKVSQREIPVIGSDKQVISQEIYNALSDAVEAKPSRSWDDLSDEDFDNAALRVINCANRMATKRELRQSFPVEACVSEMEENYQAYMSQGATVSASVMNLAKGIVQYHADQATVRESSDERKSVKGYPVDDSTDPDF